MGCEEKPNGDFGGVIGVRGGWSSEVIAPQIAQADTKRVEVSLDRQSHETYQNLLSRAEAVALSAVQQSFDQDIQMTDVSVMIMGQNQRDRTCFVFRSQPNSMV